MRDPFAGRVRGICLRDLPGNPAPTDRGFDVRDAIAATAAAGATLLHLPSVRAASAALDAVELGEARAAAEARGVTLTASLPPVHPDRRAQLWGEDTDAPPHPFAQIRAAAALGVSSLHVTVGQEEDRARVDPPWQDQLDRTVPVLRELVARAAAPVVLKTHEEMTTAEALELCAAVPGLRLGFSPVNVVARLEDPLAAARRVAEHVHTVFLDDCALVRDRAGLARSMRAIGAGALPWADMLSVLPADAPVVVDLHRAELAMPLYDPRWLALQPDLPVTELVALYAVAEGSPGSEDDLATRRDNALGLLAASARELDRVR